MSPTNVVVKEKEGGKNRYEIKKIITLHSYFDNEHKLATFH